ncbi:MAG: hypothetical protein ACLTLQ_05975 [[Clostridium] scindens]
MIGVCGGAAILRRNPSDREYGRITTSDNDGQGAGGMVGCLYDLRTTFGSVTITRCANHGTITGASSGGMIGFASQKAAEVHLRKCVNTGLLSANGNIGGMLGITGSISGKSTIIGCNNYGFGINSAKIGGMVPTNLKTEITIQDCFGLADLDYPISPPRDICWRRTREATIIWATIPTRKPRYIMIRTAK